MADYHAYCRDNDLYLTYVIINPQADRSKNWGEHKKNLRRRSVLGNW